MNNILYLNEKNALPQGYSKYVLEIVEKFKTNNNGKIPTKKEITDLGISIKPLIDTFGGWKKALTNLGIIKTDKNITEQLVKLKEKINRLPTLLDLKNEGISINLVIKEYGSWGNARKALSGEENISTATEIENHIIDLTKNLNRVPTVQDIKDANIDIKPLINKYDSWTNAKKSLNIVNYINKESVVNLLSKEEIKNIKTKIIEIQDKLGKKPSISDLKNTEIPLRKLIKHFGNWNKAYDLLNLNDNLIALYKRNIVSISKELGRAITIRELKDYNIPISVLTSNQKWSEIVDELNLNDIEKDVIKSKIVLTAKELGYRPLMNELSKKKINYSKILSDYENIADMYEKLGVPEDDKTKTVDLSDVIFKLNLLQQVLGEVPSLEQAVSNKIKVRKAIRVYGTWKNFLKETGFLNNEENIDDIINKVKDLAEKLGHTPSIVELKQNDIKYGRLQYKYGSYNKALSAIGLSVNRVLSEDDEANIIKQIKEVYTKLGYAPSNKELKENGIKTSKILNKYKGLTNLYKEIGIQTTPNVSKKELMEKLVKAYSKLNKFPTISEAKKEGIDIKAMKMYFKSWKDCELEFSKNYKANNLELEKKSFIELAIQLEKAPTIDEAKEYGINTRDLISAFKGWKNVCTNLYQENSIKEAI